MSKIKIIKSDLFKCNEHLAHGTNCQGVFGKGIAVKFKKEFPEMYAEYRKRGTQGLIIPGSCWTWNNTEQLFVNKQGKLEEENRFIFNLAIKTHWRLPASYFATKAAFKNLVDEIQERNIKKVAMPWIGCGLGGLPKIQVKDIMQNAIDNTDITFYVYEL